MSAILQVDELHRHFGGLRAVDGATFEIETGVIAAIIGPNGAGKTTCFNCVAGFLQPPPAASGSTARRSPARPRTASLARGWSAPSRFRRSWKR